MAQRRIRAAFDSIAEPPESPAANNGIPPLCGSARLKYIICAFLAMAVEVLFCKTINLATCTAKHYQPNDDINYSNIDENDTCEPIDISAAQTEKSGNVFWTQSEESWVLGTYYYGYLILAPFAGRLADKFGGKWVIVSSIILQSLIFLLILIAHQSYLTVAILRFIQGLIAGCGQPAIYQLLTVWSHTNERTAFVSIVYGGYSFGTLLMLPISYFFCAYGWQLAFYLVIMVSVVVAITCCFLIHNNLEDHPNLSQHEHNYLMTCSTRLPNDNIPWKDILSSLPLYAFLCIHLAHNYGLSVLALLLPKFFHHAMRFPIYLVDLISAAPSFGAIGAKLIIFLISHIVDKKPNLDFTHYRRIICFIGCSLTVIFLFGIVCCSCRERDVVVLLTVLIGATTDITLSCGYWSSILHIAPSFVGLLVGIANCLGTLTGFLAPVALSYTVVKGNKYEWNIIMMLQCIFFLWGALIFTFWGTSVRAPWDQQRVILRNEESRIEEIVSEEEEERL